MYFNIASCAIEKLGRGAGNKVQCALDSWERANVQFKEDITNHYHVCNHSSILF